MTPQEKSYLTAKLLLAIANIKIATRAMDVGSYLQVRECLDAADKHIYPVRQEVMDAIKRQDAL